MLSLHRLGLGLGSLHRSVDFIPSPFFSNSNTKHNATTPYIENKLSSLSCFHGVLSSFPENVLVIPVRVAPKNSSIISSVLIYLARRILRLTEIAMPV